MAKFGDVNRYCFWLFKRETVFQRGSRSAVPGRCFALQQARQAKDETVDYRAFMSNWPGSDPENSVCVCVCV